jgi:glucokinase-like ROK family protein
MVLSDVTLIGSNTNRIKMHNVRAVLLHMLYNEPSYRVRIAEHTSLSTTTITNIIDELIGQGIVEEVGVEAPQGQRRVGRPRAALRLVQDARYALGVQIGVETYKIAVTDLKAEVIHNQTFTFSRDTSPEDVFATIADQVETIILENGLERQSILGLGVGAAGLVNYHTGVNILSTNLGWENVPIRDWLSNRLNIPVVVDNNVKAMALGESYFGSGRDYGSLVFVYGRMGVGSGIVIDNHLLRGADLGAGEIGHMIILAGSGKNCRCGQCGCLETLTSETALMNEARELAQAHPDSLLAQYLQDGGRRPIEQLFQAARDGDPLAVEMVERASRYLGIALANLVNLLNPEMIVLGGLFAQGQDLMLPVAGETLRKTAFAGLGKKVILQASKFGWQAGIVGACALALTSFFYLNPEEI